MPPPEGEDELDWTLYSISGDLLPTPLRDFETSRLRILLQVIDVIDDDICTDAVVQKFCYYLQENNVTPLAPTRLYLGGRWDFLRQKELDGLCEEGVIFKYTSDLNNFDMEVYSIDPRFESAFESPKIFEEKFQSFRKKYNLRNPFKDHDRRDIYKWVTDPETYIERFRNEFECARHGDTETEVNLIKDEVNYDSPPPVSAVNSEYRPFVATAYHLVSEYKYIPSAKSRNKRTGKFLQSQRMFAQRFANRQYKDSRLDVIGDLVLHTGIIDPASIYRGKHAELWESPRRKHSIKVDLSDRTYVSDDELITSSIVVLGYLTELDGDLGISPFAILKSSDLPKPLIHEQRNRLQTSIGGQVDAIGHINEAIARIEALSEGLETSERTKLRELIIKLERVESIGSAIELLLDFKSRNPQLEWLIQQIIDYIASV